MPVTRPEILAPAGTPDKLRTALHFGADAVYLGLRRFSLRSLAGNFDLDELEWALAYAHGLGRRVYVAVNIQPFDRDFDELEQALGKLAALAPDGLIVADPGVLDLARRVAPGVSLHLSTQASVTNARAARFWFGQGCRRIIVARELSLEQLGRLATQVDGELEAFVHGAVCIAYSGRCLLSLYWADRDPRLGACAQGCRWQYRAIADQRRPGEANPVEQDERGTYFFDAKDLCALPVLDRLLATGVRALKIEGRTRSEHYVGITVDVYRQAVAQLATGDHEGFQQRLPDYLAELARPGGRGFSTHFLTGGEPGIEAYNPQGSYPDGRYGFLGRITARSDDHVDLALRNPLHPGTTVELRDRGMRSESVTLDTLHAPDGTLLPLGHAGDTVRIQGRFESTAGALARLGSPG
ncbi:MAG: peptidase U32 family protein [bacterium]